MAQTTNSAIAARHGTVAGAARSDAVSLALIGATIITAVEDSASLIGFYERAYSHRGPEADVYARWRALSAVAKADHVIGLCARAGLAPFARARGAVGEGERGLPFALDRSGRELHHLGGLFDREASEEAKFHDERLALVQCCQVFEGLVQRQQVESLLGEILEHLIERHSLAITTTLPSGATAIPWGL